ncbi:hypothetical protein D3C87_1673670 [compost metagenome]
MLRCRSQQHLFHLVQIRTVRHAEADHHASDGVGKRPVDQTFGHEGFVRDDHLFAVEVGDRRRTDADLADRPGEGADGDRIADTHRAFEQNDQARDEVPEDLLQTETETDRQRSGQPL